MASMKIVHDIVDLAFRRAVRAHDFTPEKEAIKTSKQATNVARNIARDELAKFFDPNIKDIDHTQSDASEICLTVISLLQVRRIILMYNSKSHSDDQMCVHLQTLVFLDLF